MAVRIQNQQAQAHTIMVKGAGGKLVTRHIPANGFLEVSEDKLSQDVYDKNRRGIVRLFPVAPKKVAEQPTALPKAAMAAKKLAEKASEKSA